MTEHKAVKAAGNHQSRMELEESKRMQLCQIRVRNKDALFH